MNEISYPTNPILIVDDEPEILKVFDTALRYGGINNIICCEDSRKVISILRTQEIEVLLLDVMMPYLNGEKLLAELSQEFPEMSVIMITGVYEIETAVKCMKLGAFDYLLKPVGGEQLIFTVRRALEMQELRHENSILRYHFLNEELERPEAFKSIITQSKKMHSIFNYCEAVAVSHHPVLITGETGTGKELIARALHKLSGRTGDFIAVNVAGLDDTMFSDTLFGHTKGAFTGADDARRGLIEKADNGTLLLDEVGDLCEVSQLKLLRLLEQREYFPVGSDTAKMANSWILVTTHKDLEALQKSGHFRSDLYFRLHSHNIYLPPLRERKEDIPLLFDHFLDEVAKEFNKKRPAYKKDLLNLLQSYNYPGNVRELKTMVLDAVSTHKEKLLSLAAFKKIEKTNYKSAVNSKNNFDSWFSKLDQLPKLKEATNELIDEAMKRSKNNQRIAALLLGITPQALSQRLKRRTS